MKTFSRLVTLTFAMATTTVFAGDWTDDWFDQSIKSGPTSIQSQTRGYYSAGSFSARRRMTNDRLITATPPRLEVGCGGIDMFGGGLSYLDGEYLVEKLESVVSAAPAFAFELALQEYCKPCVTAMTTLENITNTLNQTQLNDCRLAKRLAVAMVPENPEIQGELRAEVASYGSLFTGQRKNPQDFQEGVRESGGAAPDRTEETMEGCPQIFKDTFLSGSILQNAADLVGVGSYAPIMRGLIGDAVVDYNENTNLYDVRPLTYCLANDNIDPRDFLDGTVENMNIVGECSPSGSKPVIDEVEDQLWSIANKFQPGSDATLTSEEIAFLAKAPFPILPLLRDAALSQNVETQIGLILEPLSMGYAQAMLDDLQKLARFVVVKANEVADHANTPETPDGPQDCKLGMVQEAIDHMRGMEEKISLYRAHAQANYARQMQTMQANLFFIQQMIETRRRAMNQQSLTQE